MPTPININHNQITSDSLRLVLNNETNSTQRNTENNARNLTITESTEIEREENTSNINNNANLITEQETASDQSLDRAVEDLNSYFQSVNRSLAFNIDDDSGTTIVKITDTETDQLIRQIPNDEALKIARDLNYQIQLNSDDLTAQGLLLSELKA